MSEQDTLLSLPDFTNGTIVKETIHFRVVMGFKPGLEGQPDGARFFIEPLDDDAESMLKLAAKAHHIPNFNQREVRTLNESKPRECLRADFIADNLPALLHGHIDIPTEGSDSVPSPDRMEACLKLHPTGYTFSDSN